MKYFSSLTIPAVGVLPSWLLWPESTMTNLDPFAKIMYGRFRIVFLEEN